MTERRQHVRIVTPERVVYDEEARFVAVPGSEGDLGILPGHAPLITTLRAGRVRIKKSGTQIGLDITGGLMHIAENTVTVLAPAVHRAE